MKLVTAFLLACVVLGLAKADDQEPTEPGTFIGFGKTETVIAGNTTLTVQFGEANKPSWVKVTPCYGENVKVIAGRSGLQQNGTFEKQTGFIAGFESSSDVPTLSFETKSPDASYAPYEGMFEVLSFELQSDFYKMCPQVTEPEPSFTIDMKKKSNNNKAILTWTPVSDTDVTYEVYRRDIKIGSGEDPIPDGVYNTVCGAKLLFTKDADATSAISKKNNKYSCAIENLDTKTITSVMVAVTKTSTGCSVPYNLVKLNDGASALSCAIAIILFFAFYLFY